MCTSDALKPKKWAGKVIQKYRKSVSNVPMWSGLTNLTDITSNQWNLYEFCQHKRRREHGICNLQYWDGMLYALLHWVIRLISLLENMFLRLPQSYSVFYYLAGHQEWIKTKTDDTATFSEQPFLCNYSYNSDKGCGGGWSSLQISEWM